MAAALPIREIQASTPAMSWALEIMATGYQFSRLIGRASTRVVCSISTMPDPADPEDNSVILSVTPRYMSGATTSELQGLGNNRHQRHAAGRTTVS